MNKTKPKISILLIHGMSEHSARYQKMAKYFENHDVHLFDLHGFGKLDGYGITGGTENLLNQIEKEYKKIENENVIIVAHSYGSLLARLFLAERKPNIKGLILSGSAGHPGFKAYLGLFLASIACIWAKNKKSPFFDNITFSDHLSKISNPLSPHDWLSENPKWVKEYCDDPLCGNICSTGFYKDLAKLALKVNSQKCFDNIPQNLKMLLLSGANDPVTSYGADTKEILDRLPNTENSQIILYPKLRHEIIIHHENVWLDILNWIEKLDNLE